MQGAPDLIKGMSDLPMSETEIHHTLFTFNQIPALTDHMHKLVSPTVENIFFKIWLD